MPRLITLEEWLCTAAASPGVLGESNEYAASQTDDPNRGGGLPCGWVQAPVHLACSWLVTMAAPKTRGIGGLSALMDPLANTVFPEQRRAFARIEWGLGGISHTVDIDWRAGLNCQFFGSAVRVRSIVPLPASIAVPRSLSTIRLGATISPANSGATYPIPTMTRFLGDVLPGTVAFCSVPNFARSVAPCFRVDSLAEPWQVEFYNNTTLTCVFDGRNFLNPAFAKTIDLPPNTSVVGFRNLNGVPPPPAETFFDVSMIFELGL